MVFYCYDVKDVSTGGNYHGEVFWNCLNEYVIAQKSFENRSSLSPKQKESLSSHHADSNNYNMLYAFYAIYRCENRPKAKYAALKRHITNYQRVMGGE